MPLRPKSRHKVHRTTVAGQPSGCSASSNQRCHVAPLGHAGPASVRSCCVTCGCGRSKAAASCTNQIVAAFTHGYVGQSQPCENAPIRCAGYAACERRERRFLMNDCLNACRKSGSIHPEVHEWIEGQFHPCRSKRLAFGTNLRLIIVQSNGSCDSSALFGSGACILARAATLWSQRTR